MQSKARQTKRIMSGRQNPMPNSQKIAKSSLNNPAVFRKKKFVLDPVTKAAEVYDPSQHLY